MRHILLGLILAVALPAYSESEKKVVCHVDENDKNKKQTCKTIRVHHRAERVTSGSPTDPEPKKGKK